jgi:hypothetical protein
MGGPKNSLAYPNRPAFLPFGFDMGLTVRQFVGDFTYPRDWGDGLLPYAINSIVGYNRFKDEAKKYWNDTWEYSGYLDISGPEDLQEKVRWDREHYCHPDHYIDVFVLDGHGRRSGIALRGKDPNDIRSALDLQAFRDHPELVQEIKRSLSKRGVIIIAGCGCGDREEEMKKLADLFGVPIIAPIGNSPFDWKDPKGAWKTYYPKGWPFK